MNIALTPGSSLGQALAHSRQAGEGTERCFKRLRIDGGWSGVLCFSLDSRVRGNDARGGSDGGHGMRIGG